jgi:flagellar protein FlaG
MNVNTVQKVQEAANATSPVAPSPVVVDAEGIDSTRKAADQIRSLPLEEAQKDEPLPAKEMKELANDLNEYMDVLQTDLGFFINKDLNDTVIVEIKNRKTNELVKQIPSEEIVQIREKMAELTGLLLDKSV